MNASSSPDSSNPSSPRENDRTPAANASTLPSSQDEIPETGSLSSDPHSSVAATFVSSEPNTLTLPSQGRPNTELTSAEKQAKRRGKRHLKQRTRIRKYEVRWSQAVGRQDTAVAARARGELRDYLTALRNEGSDSLWYQSDFPQVYRTFLEDETGTVSVPTVFSNGNYHNNTALTNCDAASVAAGRHWMTRTIWQKLVLKMILPVPDSAVQENGQDEVNDTLTTRALRNYDHNPLKHLNLNDEEATLPLMRNGRSRKHQQTMQARDLLNHMAKGTQTESMFDNDEALIGYTRQKFMERALLALKSLQRVRPVMHQASLWKALTQVRSVLSIGCGPGCDAVGILTFLRRHRPEDTVSLRRRRRPLLDRLVLMDYVMPRWKRLVLSHLIPLLTEPSPDIPMVSQVKMASCDVRYPLTTDPRNREAWNCLYGSVAATADGGGGGGGDQDSVDWNATSSQSSMDLIVVSYLLTETRDQWLDFFRDVVRENAGCLLLLSEPTAWQLHSFLAHFTDDNDSIQNYQWLDSSRDSPHLQSLEKRLGPAVLLVQTKKKTQASK